MIEFKNIKLEEDFDICFQFRQDAYFCSFGTLVGFSKFISGYKERVYGRIAQKGWFYIHVWVNNEIVGQLEFRNFYSEPKTGYVNLIYLKPQYRSKGLAGKLQSFIKEKLLHSGCDQAILSVSRTNQRAVKHYQKFGWEYQNANPKNELTDFYKIKLRT